jgi:release factor glutamine methyltransferase
MPGSRHAGEDVSLFQDERPVPSDLFTPSVYSAALLRQLRLWGPCTGRALEIGTGSGVLLAAIASSGARQVVGVDCEPEAVRRTVALLRDQGVRHYRVHCGELWSPVRDERFDLVVFNPPQMPTCRASSVACRLPSWSHGGRNGREVLEHFLRDLPAHLSPDGRALITHSSFLDWDRTARLLQSLTLQWNVLQTVAVPVPDYKLQAVPRDWIESQMGRTLMSVGPYVFAEFHVVEVRHAAGQRACRGPCLSAGQRRAASVRAAR